MSEIDKKLHYRKGTNIIDIGLYDSTSDISGNDGFHLKVDNKVVYAQLGQLDDITATDLRVRIGNTIYAVLKNAIAAETIGENSEVRHWHYSGSTTNNPGAETPVNNQTIDSVNVFVPHINYNTTVTVSFDGTLVASTDAGWCEGWLYFGIYSQDLSTTIYQEKLAYWTGPSGIGSVNKDYISNKAITFPNSGTFKAVLWFRGHASGGDSMDVWVSHTKMTITRVV
jgi:hypothetical protein